MLATDQAEQIKREIRGNRYKVSGGRGLIAAIIATAAVDALGSDQAARLDALAYFAGPVYKHHAHLLGLEPDILPRGVTLRLVGN